MKIEISNGELVDKVTILKIKLEKIKAPDKLNNIRKEYRHLIMKMGALGMEESSLEFQDLLAVNRSLWEIEDKIRLKEAQQCFDAEFIDLARQVYIQNDRRAKIKREINISTGSRFIEEKAYVDYEAGSGGCSPGEVESHPKC